MVAVRDYSALNTPALLKRGVTEVLVLSSGFIYRRDAKGRWVFDRRRDGDAAYPPIIVGRPRQLRLPLQ